MFEAKRAYEGVVVEQIWKQIWNQNIEIYFEFHEQLRTGICLRSVRQQSKGKFAEKRWSEIIRKKNEMYYL